MKKNNIITFHSCQFIRVQPLLSRPVLEARAGLALHGAVPQGLRPPHGHRQVLDENGVFL